MHNKIYIIGPVGSGKTTFATKLSKLYNIKYYELDKVSWDDDHGNIKRPEEEAQKIFKEILKNKKWIIEDVGRDKFKQGRIDADIIYYIKLSRIKYNGPLFLLSIGPFSSYNFNLSSASLLLIPLILVIYIEYISCTFLLDKS